MTHSNDNYPYIPAVNDDDLPPEYAGRVTIIIEIPDGRDIRINGVKMTLAQGAEFLSTLTLGDVA